MRDRRSRNLAVTSIDAARTIDAALALAQEEERKLCAVIESDLSTPEQRFEALVDLAELSRKLVRMAARCGTRA
jgi:DNA repair photolyase